MFGSIYFGQYFPGLQVEDPEVGYVYIDPCNNRVLHNSNLIDPGKEVYLQQSKEKEVYLSN